MAKGLTNGQINKLAAEAMGIKGWHPEPENPRGGLCKKCGELVHKHRTFYHDFCDDLNAAQRLAKHTKDKSADALLDGLYGVIGIAGDENEYFKIVDLITLPAKTITLACLVALGKITLEEAKESC